MDIVALQGCISFCFMKWISYMYTYIPSLLNLPPTYLGHHRAPTELPKQYSSSLLLIYFTCVVCICQPQSPSYTTSLPLPPLCLCLYSCPADRFICTTFLPPCICVNIQCFSPSDLLHSVWQTSTSLQMTSIAPFDGWVIFHSMYVPHPFCPLICQWTFRLLPHPGYCK